MPSVVLTINGTSYDVNGRRAPRLLVDRWSTFERDGIPTATFVKHSSQPYALPDPYLGKSVSIAANGTTYFAGDVWRVLPHKQADRKYSFTYTCLGLRARGERIAVTDDNTGTDACAFNIPRNEPGYLAARAGRTTGQVLTAVLSMTANRTPLTAAGLGNYVPGSGATAHANLAGSTVGSVTVDTQGNGYGGAVPSVIFSGGGGTGATGHAVIGGGAASVVSIIVDTPGSGYTSPPAVIISNLPFATANDLAAMNLIPPFPCIVQGEKFFNALEAFFKPIHWNHHLHVQPDGTIRFLDQRKFGGTSVTFSGGGGVGAMAMAVVSAAGVVTGLILIDGGKGYTSNPTVAITGSPGTGATGTATASGGKVTSLSLGAGGSGYPEGRTANFLLGVNPLDPPEFHRDIAHCFTRVVVRGRRYIEGNEFSLAKGDLAEFFDHDGLNNADAKAKWKPADYNQPSQAFGAATATATLATTGISTTFTITNGGSGYTSAPTIAFGGGGGTGAAATATVSGGVVTSITRTAAGSGYSTAPTMSFSGGGGAGATATTTLQSRAVASLSLVDGGYSYTSAPTVTFSGGGGSGATATTTISGGVVNAITLGAGGSGYTSAPTVHIGGPIGPSTDYGTCTCPNTTTVRITSDDATRIWAANFWDQTATGKHGIIQLRSSTAGTTISQLTSRRIVANTGLAAGGTSDITVDLPLDITSYDSYSIRGDAVGGSIVYRRLKFTNTVLAAAMTDEPFTYDYSFHASDGAALTLTSSKTSAILYSSTGNPPYEQRPLSFQIDPTASPPTATFDYPYVWVYGTQQNPIVPLDIILLVGIYKKNLASTQPPDSGGLPAYSGTAYSVDGLQSTLTIQVNDWRDPGQQAQIDTYTNEVLDSVKDAIIEGMIEFYGLAEGFLAGTAVVNVAGYNGATYTTGWESLNLPVERVEVVMPKDGPLAFHTSIALSNRRTPYAGQPLLSPARTGAPLGFGGGFDLFSAGGFAPGMVGAGAGVALAGFADSASNAMGGFQGAADSAVRGFGGGADIASGMGMQAASAMSGMQGQADASVAAFGGLPVQPDLAFANPPGQRRPSETLAEQRTQANVGDSHVSFAGMGSAIYQAQHSPEAKMKQQAEQSRQDIAEAKQQHREAALERLQDEAGGGGE